jgi:hypothetical protein
LSFFHFSFFPIFFLQKERDQVEEEAAPDTALSELVNYIQPVHFKSFDDSASKCENQHKVLVTNTTPGKKTK